jgi:hypothetical protein
LDRVALGLNFAPNTIDGNGTCDRTIELTIKEQAIAMFVVNT